MHYFSSSGVELLSEFLYLNWLRLKGDFEIPHCTINVLIYPMNFHLVPLQWLLKITCLAPHWEMRCSVIWIDESSTTSAEGAFQYNGGWNALPVGAKEKTGFLEMQSALWINSNSLTLIDSSDSRTSLYSQGTAEYLLWPLIGREWEAPKDSEQDNTIWKSQDDWSKCLTDFLKLLELLPSWLQPFFCLVLYFEC